MSEIADGLIFDTDSYKTSHFLQYPPGATHISSYIELRGGAYKNVLFFGLQIYLKGLKPVTADEIEAAKWEFEAHGEPFNESGWRLMLQRHGGLPPVRIQALREGSVVPTSTPLNSDHQYGCRFLVAAVLSRNATHADLVSNHGCYALDDDQAEPTELARKDVRRSRSRAALHAA